MIRAVPIATFLAGAVSSSCAGVDKTLNASDLSTCGADNPSAWSQLDQPPVEAENLRALAVADYYKPTVDPMEWWLIRSDQELILCKSERFPQKSTEGAWWKFERHNGNWTVVDQNGWIVVS